MQAHDLVTLAEAYAAHLGLQLRAVSTYAQNDGKFFHRLGDGGDCSLRVARRIVLWFAENWPADLEWPPNIPRPVTTEKGRAA